MLKTGLEPIANISTKVIILGSLPSDISIQKQQYYANNSNDFWKIMGTTFNVNFKDITYDERIKLLLSKKVGLWDVYSSAKREGSMDENISEKILNDFNKLKSIAPNIKLICFNGKEAGLSETIIKDMGFKTVVLPSSSGANRRDQESRLTAWKVIKN